MGITTPFGGSARLRVAAMLQNVTTTMTSLGAPVADSAIVGIGALDAGSGGDMRTMWIPADVIPSSPTWMTLNGGDNGKRFDIQRLSSGQIQVRRQGPVSSTNRVWLLKWE